MINEYKRKRMAERMDGISKQEKGRMEKMEEEEDSKRNRENEITQKYRVQYKRNLYVARHSHD